MPLLAEDVAMGTEHEGSGIPSSGGICGGSKKSDDVAFDRDGDGGATAIEMTGGAIASLSFPGPSKVRDGTSGSWMLGGATCRDEAAAAAWPLMADSVCGEEATRMSCICLERPFACAAVVSGGSLGNVMVGGETAVSYAAGGLDRGPAGGCCCCSGEAVPGDGDDDDDAPEAPPGNAGSGGRGSGRRMLPVLATEVVEATEDDLDKAGEGVAPTVAKRPGMLEVDGTGGAGTGGNGGDGCEGSAEGPGGFGSDLRDVEALPWLG